MDGLVHHWHQITQESDRLRRNCPTFTEHVSQRSQRARAAARLWLNHDVFCNFPKPPLNLNAKHCNCQIGIIAFEMIEGINIFRIRYCCCFLYLLLYF